MTDATINRGSAGPLELSYLPKPVLWNFVGKGWARFRHSRPINHFDLAAKVHDIHYDLNDLGILSRPVVSKAPLRLLSGKLVRTWLDREHQKPAPDIDLKFVSRIAKADRIFRIMNEHRQDMQRHWGNSRGCKWVRTMNRMSQWLFLDRPGDEAFFVKDDGFRNLFASSDPAATARSFGAFIPRHALAAPPGNIYAVRCPNSGQRLHKWVDDHESLVDEERETDMFAWFDENYGPVMDKIRAITDQTGKTLPRA